MSNGILEIIDFGAIIDVTWLKTLRGRGEGEGAKSAMGVRHLTK